MAFDRARGKVVLHGGVGMVYPSWVNYTDTWTWEGANWTQMVTPTAPTVRYGAAFAYDPVLQKCILFGGGAGNGVLADTWEWDGATWTQLNPATIPPGRARGHLTFDANGGRLALTGGSSPIAQPAWNALTDHWEWDGSNWVLVNGNILYNRYGSVSFFDTGRNRLVQYGGATYWGVAGDTREFDGAVWSAVTIASPPPARAGSAGFYDSWRGTGVMHGGWGVNSPSNPYAETWLFTDVNAATATSYGAGCTGAAGPISLQVVQRPVVQTNLTIFVANVNPFALPVMVVGLTPVSIGIGGVFGAGPTCFLRTTMDIIEVLPPSSTWSLPIPNNPALLGFAIHNQAAQFTYDAGTNTYATSLSNAVRSTVGLY